MTDIHRMAKSDLKDQIVALRQIVESSTLLSGALAGIPELGLSNWYLGGGSLAQTAWNMMSGYDLNRNIKDLDIVYFDADDLSYEAEDSVIKRGQALLKDLPVEVEFRNQARVHLWYDKKFGSTIKPYNSTEEAITTWPTLASSVGVSLDPDFRVFAPYGLHDLFAMIARPNKLLVSKEAYDAKVGRWAMAWPDMTALTW
jgi:hypothetical protein